MPPKRKRATEEAASEPKTTRATRSSARNQQAAKEKEETATTSTTAVGDQVVAPEPSGKRQRKSTAKSTASKTTSASRKKSNTKKSVANGDDDPTDQAQGDIRPDTTSSSSPIVISKPTATTTTTKPSKPSQDLPKLDPYSSAQATSLFTKYVEEDDKDVIGPEGIERLCGDIGVSLEDASPLLLAWQMGATEMAKLRREEWEKGTSELKVSSPLALSLVLRDLNNLVILNKPPIKLSTAVVGGVPGEPYDRKRYSAYAADPRKAFGELYLFSFILVKPPQSRNIDMETACAFWSVLIAPQYPLMRDVLGFINDKGTYKGVTKDLWSMMLEFCQTISPTLDDYEADGAWPTLLDDFVNWKKSQTKGGEKSSPSVTGHA